MLPPQPLKPFLEKNGFEIRSQTRKEIQCLCLWHDDDNASFSISKQTGRWRCFAGCGAGEFDDLLKKLNTTIEIDIRESIQSILEEKQSSAPSKSLTIKLIEFPKEFSKLTVNTSAKYWNYATDRLKAETIERFNLQYCETGFYKQRIVIPVYLRNNLVAYLCRSIDPESPKRYLNAYDTDMSNYLFNYDSIQPDSEILVCESSFDCMSAVEKGYVNSVSTFGTNISARQKELLAELKPKKLILCFHNDKAGVSIVHKNLTYLKTLAPIERIYLPNNPKKDINMCTKEEFDKIYSKRSDMSSKIDYIRNRILNKLHLLI